MTDVDKFTEELALGRHDDDLPRLVEAIGGRIVAAGGGTRWRISLADVVVDEDNLTLDECEKIEKATGRSWLTLSPAHSATQARAVLRVALQSRLGLSDAETDDRLSKITVREVAEALSEYAVVPAGND